LKNQIALNQQQGLVDLFASKPQRVDVIGCFIKWAGNIDDFNPGITAAKVVFNYFRQVAGDHKQTREPMTAQGTHQPLKDGDSINFNQTFRG
jgi:hypothetical protein